MPLTRVKYEEEIIYIDLNESEKINRGEELYCRGYHHPHYHTSGYDMDGNDLDIDVCEENCEEIKE